MHLFFIYENKVKTMKESSKKLKRPSHNMFMNARKILDQTVQVIKKGDYSEAIFKQIVILQSRKYSTRGEQDSASKSSIEKIYDMVQRMEYDRLNQLFAQFLGSLGQHDLSEFDFSGNQVVSTIDDHLNKWRNIKSQLQDLREENSAAQKVLAAIGAEDYSTIWKKSMREIEQVVSVLEKLRREYAEINN